MFFGYKGEYPAGKSELACYGRYVFSPGAVVELPEPFASKARGNPFFFEVAIPVVPPELPPPLAEPEAGPTREELIAVAEAHGVEIDKRWGRLRIAEALRVKLTELQGANHGQL